jgi:hypothetical protein
MIILTSGSEPLDSNGRGVYASRTLAALPVASLEKGTAVDDGINKHSFKTLFQKPPQAWVRGLEVHARKPKDKSVGYRRRIPGVCLCRGVGFGCLDHGHELLRC